MYVLRNIRESDFEQTFKLATEAHAGLISLPKNETLLQEKISHTLDSFAADLWAPQDECYLFVMEEIETGNLVGISGIYSKTGVTFPMYYYTITKEERCVKKVMNRTLPQQKLLTVIDYQKGPSELGSLFLRSDYRKGGLGKLLSLARFLFIASNRQRFNDIIRANLRGKVTKEEICPFWDSIGRRFIDVEFNTILKMIQNDRSIIPHILPKHPIYISLLPAEVQKIIGSPHRNSAGALRLLLGLNFSLCKEVDVLDGGPNVQAFIDQIPIIVSSKVAEVRKLEVNAASEPKMILATIGTNFRATFGNIKELDDQTAAIEERDAKILEIGIGDRIRYSPIYIDRDSKLRSV